ncbi:MAG: hypothetical protein F6J97_26295 [Leptolyngbya sp. SIO4C1]|nr:hypothetical protein [Leptolyngbya sp. SIO4C1]
MTQTLSLANQANQSIQSLKKLQRLRPSDLSADYTLDPTRLTLDTAPLGITGFAADEFLHTQWGVTAELPTLCQLTFIFSLGNTADDIAQLTAALTALCSQPIQGSLPALQAQMPATQSAMTPRQAFFAQRIACPISVCAGRISAETVCAYPPGIPTLLPGDTITADAIAQLQQLQAAGAILSGNSDPTLQTIAVVQSS